VEKETVEHEEVSSQCVGGCGQSFIRSGISKSRSPQKIMVNTTFILFVSHNRLCVWINICIHGIDVFFFPTSNTSYHFCDVKQCVPSASFYSFSKFCVTG